MAADIDIEPGFRGGDLDIERLVRAAHAVRQHQGDGRRAIEPRRQHRTGFDRNQIVAACRHEADDHRLALPAGMESDAASACAMGIDEIGDRRLDAGTAERGQDLLALPLAIEAGRHVLGRAAAAAGEERADRGDARIRRGDDLDELAALAIDDGTHGLARQRVGDEDAAGGGLHDAVALLAEAIDGENFIHGELRRRNFSRLRLGD